ncbi:MAG: hypothetical protein ACPGPE_12165 [Planctomycetota bacterium]
MLTLLAPALAPSPCQPSEVTPAAPSSTERFWGVMAADEDRLTVGQEAGSGNLRRPPVFEPAPGTGTGSRCRSLRWARRRGVACSPSPSTATGPSRAPRVPGSGFLGAGLPR